MNNTGKVKKTENRKAGRKMPNRPYPLPKAKNDPRLSGQCTVPPDPKLLPLQPNPYIPSVNCKDTSPVTPAAHELWAARNEYKANPAFKNRIKNAVKAWLRLGSNLFKAAVLSKNPTEAIKYYWDQYCKVAKSEDFRDLLTETLINLSESNLSIEDKTLFYLQLTNEPNPLSSAFEKRIARAYKQMTLDYNGWQGNGLLSPSSQFIGILRQYLGRGNYEKLIGGLIRKNPQEFLVATSLKRFNQLVSMPVEKMLELYRETLTDFQNTSPGSFAKIKLSHKYNDFQCVLLARGQSPESIELQEHLREVQNLSDEERSALVTIIYSAAFDTGDKTSPQAKYFLNKFGEFVNKYLKAENKKSKDNYSQVLHSLDGYAARYGIPRSELDQLLFNICKEQHCRMIPKGQGIKALSDLSSKKDFEISPEGLPQEVKDLLQKTGYWELVSKNIYSIFLTREIKVSGGAFSMNAAGRACPILKRVEIDYFRDGKMIPAWEFAMILVHEAAHNAWRGENIFLQQQTPGERNAYAYSLEFMRKLDLPKDKAEAAAFKSIMARDRMAVISANLVLGYPENNLSPRVTMLPSREFLAKHGLKDPAELDLDFYPTNPPSNFLNDYNSFVAFAKKINPEIDGPTLQILWRILSGESQLEIRFRIKDGQIVGTPLLFEDNGKPRYRLSVEQSLKLSQFFDKLAIYSSGKENEGQLKPYLVLINNAKQRNSNIKLALKLAMQYIAKPIADLDAEIKKLSAAESLEYFPEKHKAFLSVKFPLFAEEIKRSTAGQTVALDEFVWVINSIRRSIDNKRIIEDLIKDSKNPRANAKFRQLVGIMLKLKDVIQKITANPDEQRILIDEFTLKSNETYYKSSIWLSRSITPSSLRELLFSVHLAKSI